LADDITEGGLQHKVLCWTDADGTTWLLDGRNRVDALELAGWEAVKDGRRLYWGDILEDVRPNVEKAWHRSTARFRPAKSLK
jgi:hypothetical protein